MLTRAEALRIFLHSLHRNLYYRAHSRNASQLRELHQMHDKSLVIRRHKPLVVDEKPTFAQPDSQLVSASQFYEERYTHWLAETRLPYGLDRKCWEYTFILHAIDYYVGLKHGMLGLGFGVGKERLPAVMVKHNCSLTITDYIPPGEQAQHWEARKIEDLYFDEIISSELLRKNAKFREVNMNHIPDDLVGFDFLWSTGSLEHIGGHANGLAFVESAMRCLKPGGIAVHTTEFTLTSPDVSFNDPNLSFYCRRDIEDLANRLIQSGHQIVLNFRRGDTVADTHVDTPPFTPGMTLTAHLGLHVITSIGLIIQKGV
jgi:hypothetical protein